MFDHGLGCYWVYRYVHIHGAIHLRFVHFIIVIFHFERYIKKKLRDLTPLAFLLQLKGHLCTTWTPESLGRDLVDKRICDPRPEPPWRRRPSLRQLSQLCRKGQGSGCLGSTNQKESVALPNKIALSVFGWLLLEKRRSYSLHGRLESFGNTFY